MGFSTVSSFIIMFFAMLIMISSVFMIYGTLIDNTGAISDLQSKKQKSVQTSISILNASLNKTYTPDLTVLSVVNDGKRKLNKNDVDVYLDGVRIPRDENNRTIRFVSGNNINPLHWDPDEIIEINVSLDLGAGSHRAVVATEFGISDSTVFS